MGKIVVVVVVVVVVPYQEGLSFSS